MPIAYTTNLGFTQPGIGTPDSANLWGGQLNTGDIELLDTAAVGTVSIELSNANVDLTFTDGAADQSRYKVYQFTGTLTANVTVLWPQGVTRVFTVNNATSGGFTLTLAANNGAGSPAGATQVINQGWSQDFYSDGSNVFGKNYLPSTTTQLTIFDYGVDTGAASTAVVTFSVVNTVTVANFSPGAPNVVLVGLSLVSGGAGGWSSLGTVTATLNNIPMTLVVADTTGAEGITAIFGLAMPFGMMPEGSAGTSSAPTVVVSWTGDAASGYAYVQTFRSAGTSAAQAFAGATFLSATGTTETLDLGAYSTNQTMAFGVYCVTQENISSVGGTENYISNLAVGDISGAVSVYGGTAADAITVTASTAAKISMCAVVIQQPFIFLNVGDKLIQYYENGDGVSDTSNYIPMLCNCTEGIYRVRWTCLSSTSANCDLTILPNNTTSASDNVYNWGWEVSDYYFTAFGSATEGISYGALTAQPYVGTIPYAWAHAPNSSPQNVFYFDIFAGPSGDDPVNDRGPFIAEFIISTYTAYKAVLCIAGDYGGPGHAYGVWTDTTTPWTSLGYLGLAATTNTDNTSIIQIERLA